MDECRANYYFVHKEEVKVCRIDSSRLTSLKYGICLVFLINVYTVHKKGHDMMILL